MTKPALRTPRYAGGRPRTLRTYEIFISSGSDLAEQRNLLRQLVDAFNKQARDARVDYQIAVRAWEDAVSRRTFDDGNREFRFDAEIANLVIVLLHRDLRPGTEEELDAALQSPDVQVAIILMDPPPATTRVKAEKHLREKMAEIRDKVRWYLTDEPGHISVTIAMVSILARLFIDLSSPEQESSASEYTEVR